MEDEVIWKSVPDDGHCNIKTSNGAFQIIIWKTFESSFLTHYITFLPNGIFQEESLLFMVLLCLSENPKVQIVFQQEPQLYFA